MIYKVGVLGATGKMGLEVCALLAQGFEVAGDRLELCDAIARTKKIQSIEGVDIRTISEPPREPVHIWIDFSRCEATLALLRQVEGRVLIGTTGFSDAQASEIRAYGERHPVLLTANTSPGMNLVARMLRLMAPRSSFPCDVVVSDEHHRNKKDSPSGTAKMLVQLLKDLGHENIQVQVARVGGSRGNHSIKFAADDEEIEIRHQVTDRKVFAKGALLGALYIMKINKPGIYSMDEVFP